MLQSARVRTAPNILQSLRSNPYVKPNEASTIAELLGGKPSQARYRPRVQLRQRLIRRRRPLPKGWSASAEEEPDDVPEEAISAYLTEHAAEIVAEEGKPFQPIGGIMELLGSDYFPVSAVQEIAAAPKTSGATPSPAAAAEVGHCCGCQAFWPPGSSCSGGGKAREYDAED